MSEGFSNKEMLQLIMQKQGKHDDKLDKIIDEQGKTNAEVAGLKGEFKVMNGQVQRNKKDIKGIKALSVKIATGVGTAASAVFAGIFNFIK